MCNHTSVKVKVIEFTKLLNASFPRKEIYQEFNHANRFAHPNLASLSANYGRSMNIYSYGLIPSWVKEWNGAKKICNQTLNARS